MNNDIKKILISQEDIQKMLEKLSNEINNDYKGKKPLFIGLLNGCVPFMCDLLKYINVYCTTSYIKVSSYCGKESTGKINVLGSFPDVSGKDVILVDDILDTGRTLKECMRLLIENNASSVKICVLLDKPEGRKVDIEADYSGGLVPNEFVVGYGLDYNEYYRNLPYIGVLKEEVYKR